MHSGFAISQSEQAQRRDSVSGSNTIASDAHTLEYIQRVRHVGPPYNKERYCLYNKERYCPHTKHKIGQWVTLAF